MKILSRTVGAFAENSYLVIDEPSGRGVLIDPGAEPEVILEMVRGSGAVLQAIWLTHAHLDHVGAVAGVTRAFPVPVYLHPLDAPIYERAAAQAAVYGIPFEQPGPADAELSEGDLLELGATTFRVLHVPGHAPGHVIFVAENVMLGGDLLFAGSIGRTDLPFGDPSAMDESLRRLSELAADTAVYPGHGPVTTIGVERESNPFLSGAVRIARR